MKIEWPIWWCLSVVVQAALMRFQFDTYGYRLQVPPMPDFSGSNTKLESLEEIDKIIRVPSKYPKGFYSHG